jgi:hypothetical protein
MIEAELPDGTVLEFPAGTSQDVIQRVVKQRLGAATPKPSFGEQFKKEVVGSLPVQLGLGAIRGAGSIGATLKAPFDYAEQGIAKMMGADMPAPDRRKAMDAALQGFGADPSSVGYNVGKIGGEIAGTAGIGGLLARGAESARLAPSLVDALRTGGMSAAGKTGLASIPARVAGGAVVGGASAGVAGGADDIGMGAALGGAIPVMGIGAVKVGSAVRKAFAPEIQKRAAELAKVTGANVNDVLAALQQQGPSAIGQGYQRTVPQILQNPELSQLQRTLKTAGNDALGGVERLQQQQFRNALERVAPIQATPFDAAQRAGGAIQNYAIPARENATQAVRNAFDSVDMQDASRLFLPIEEMQRAQSKFLGAGTFGTGTRAAQAVKTAEELGTEFIPGIKPVTQAKQTQTLEQAVRAAGGIKGGASGLGGELRSLGNKQSGTSGLMNNKSGKSADLLAQEMNARGFIPDDDPATLMEYLRNGRGRNVFASDATDDGFRAAFERSMGDAPGDMVIPKAVPFQTVQNLRSSIGEAAESASAKGANKEAAALRTMVADIDIRVNRAAGSSIAPGEYFPRDMADRYRDALAMHQQKMKKFETGSQAGMFRKGGDGQASIQGAEIPGRFYNSAMSQADDVKSFKRLIGDNNALASELKSFAMTQAANTESSMGNLGDKFVRFIKSRAGANKELFTPNELATIQSVSKEVQNQLRAEGLGRISGSDTAQKMASLTRNGMLDNRMVDLLANRVPVIGQFTGPMLQGLRNTAQSSRENVLARLLADPQLMADSLRNYQSINPYEASKYLSNAPKVAGVLAANQ